VLSSFVRGELLVSCVIATLSTVAAVILRLRYALLLGLVAGVFELVPYVGPFLGAIPALLAAAGNGPARVLQTAVAYAVIQQLEGTFLTPRIVGDAVGLHPLVVFAALLAGEHWAGLWGAVVAVPATGLVLVVWRHLRLFLTRYGVSRTIS